MRLKKARITLAASMAIFGTLGAFVRNISLAAGELSLYRAVLAAILLTGYFVVAGARFDWTALKQNMFLLLLSGGAMGINWILLFEAYRYTTVSAATLSYYFAPVIVTALCPVLFHEKMTGKQAVCFVMAAAGMVLITGVGNLRGGGSDLTGILFGLGAAVFYAAVVLLNKFMTGVSGLQRTFFQFLASIIVLIPYVALNGGFHLTELSGTGWANLLLVGLFHTGVTYCLYFTSLKDLPGQEASVLSFIDPLVAVIVSVVVLGENITVSQITGGCMVLGFAIWNEL